MATEAGHVGRVVQVIGAVVDVEFDEHHLPVLRVGDGVVLFLLRRVGHARLERDQLRRHLIAIPLVLRVGCGGGRRAADDFQAVDQPP